MELAYQYFPFFLNSHSISGLKLTIHDDNTIKIVGGLHMHLASLKYSAWKLSIESVLR